MTRPLERVGNTSNVNPVPSEQLKVNNSLPNGNTTNSPAENISSARTMRWETSNIGDYNKARTLNNATAATYPTRIHNVHGNSVDRVLSSRLNWSEVRHVRNAVYEADNKRYQTVEMSYRHAMTPAGMSREDARRLANNFVRSELQEARRLDAAGNRRQALRHLGFAMHAMQDHASPAHHPFQVYHGGRRELAGHIEREFFDPGRGSQLDLATERAYQYFTGEREMPRDFFEGIGVDRPRRLRRAINF